MHRPSEGAILMCRRVAEWHGAWIGLMRKSVFLSVLLSLVLLPATVSRAADTFRRPGPHPASQAIENPIEMSEASARQGRRIFERFCVSCHGIDGKGQTDMAADFPVAVPDFTNTEWKYGDTDGEIFTLIRGGTPNQMDAYKDRINEQRIWHLINYMRTLAYDAELKLELEAVPENPIEYNIESLKRGRILYDNHCALCHATDGTGYTDYLEFLPIPPADLTTGVFRYGTRDGDLFKIIRDGTQNGMEAFKDKLSEDDMWYTINYIRRFSR